MTASEGWRLAIDFGTSFSAAAGANGEVRALPLLGTDRWLLPSAVLVEPSGRIAVGRDALNLGGRFPDRLDRTPKRLLGRRRALLGDEPIEVARLIEAVMTEVVERARNVSDGRAPTGAVLTHPVAWEPARLELLRQAGTAAGLTDVALLPEPVAAALHLTSAADANAEQTVAVFDLGGGTLDVCVLRLAPGRLPVALAHGGIDPLGGEDFDEAIVDHIADALRNDLNLSALRSPPPDDEAAGLAALRFREEVTRAKEELSETQSATIFVVGTPHRYTLTRTEFTELIDPQLRRATRELGRVIKQAGLTPAELDAIYLVGGSSHIPAVKDHVWNDLELPRAPIQRGHPQLAVALGAAQGVEAVGSEADTVEVAGDVQPTVPLPAAPPTPPPPSPPPARKRAPEDRPQPPPPPKPPPAPKANVAATGIRVPAMTALIAAGAGLLAVIIGGVLLSVIPGADSSLFLIPGDSDLNFLDRWRLQVGQALGAPLALRGVEDGGVIELGPKVFALLPLAAIALVTTRLSRGVDVDARARYLWGVAAAVPFAIAVFILTLISKGGDTGLKISAGRAVVLAAVIGALGGLVGAWRALPAAERIPLPERSAAVVRALLPALRWFGAAFALGAVLVTLAVAIQTGRDAGDVQEGRSAAGAVAEHTLYAFEHGVRALELGTLTAFRRPRGSDDAPVAVSLPVPVTDLDPFFEDDSYRVFDYKDALPGWAFVAALGLILLPLGAAMMAGRAVARAAGAAPGVPSAAWGAAVGPLWAAIMLVLNAFANHLPPAEFFGAGRPLSAFGTMLIAAALGGAVGGLLAGRGTSSAPAGSN